MMLSSIPFIILFPVAVMICRLMGEKYRYIWLLAVSLAFYASFGPKFLVLLLFISVFTYLTALAVSAADRYRKGNVVLFFAVFILLLILFLFKYLNFTLALFGSRLRMDIMLPVGLSYYSFMAVSYLADVYKKRIAAEKNYFMLLLYLSFFLHIVSGPVNRAGDMLAAFKCPKASYEDTKEGMQKMLWGYFLKLAVAGRLAIITDNVYGNIEAHSGLSVALAALLYIFMLYCDFEGYSQIAIGGGYILGIRMKENFRQPFYAESLSQIWRRWHISLSTWFRDYLYIPLGGSRCTAVRRYINIFIVMFVSGIWHGADISFFIWGALFGILMIAGSWTLPYRDRMAASIKESDSVRTVTRRIGVYIAFAFVFIFFANKDTASSLLAIRTIFTQFWPKAGLNEIFTLGLGRLGLFVTACLMLFVMIADGAANARDMATPALFRIIPTPARWALYWALVTAIVLSANLTGKEFIYSMM